jgi:hypothetical protein
MRNYFKLIALAGLLPFSFGSAGFAQTTINGGRVIVGAWDASNAASSKPAKTGTALPMTCGIGEQFFKTDATQGQNLYFCTAEDTWVQMTGGSGGSGSGGGSAPSVLLYKGDLSGFSNQNVRIPVGPDGSTLTADSTQGSGLGYRYVTGSDVFANRPVCTPALTGQTYYPTDGIIGYRCNGTTWTGFGPISQFTPMRVNGTNSSGVIGTGSSILAAAASASGSLTLSSCQTFPSTVTMVLVDSEVIAGSCSGTTFTPIAGGRGYNQTTAAAHNAAVPVTEQLFVWGNLASGGGSTQYSNSISASSGYLAFTAIGGASTQSVLARPVPNGPNSSYTVTVGFLLNGAAENDQGCGVGFRQSSNNNQSIVFFHAITASSAFTLGEYALTNGVLAYGYYNDLGVAALTGNGMYFRLQDTLTQRNVYVSTDGINFVLIHSVEEGDFLSPDQIYLSCSGGTIPQSGSFFSYQEGN